MYLPAFGVAFDNSTVGNRTTLMEIAFHWTVFSGSLYIGYKKRSLNFVGTEKKKSILK
jgi:hypothetical protein